MLVTQNSLSYRLHPPPHITHPPAFVYTNTRLSRVPFYCTCSRAAPGPSDAQAHLLRGTHSLLLLGYIGPGEEVSDRAAALATFEFRGGSLPTPLAYTTVYVRLSAYVQGRRVQGLRWPGRRGRSCRAERALSGGPVGERLAGAPEPRTLAADVNKAGEVKHCTRTT